MRTSTGSPGRPPGFLRDCGGADENWKSPVEQSVSFGRHRFDLETGRLWSGKREVKLTPKASAVLKALVTHAGQPVRKEELFASVWKGTVVSDDALTSCIQELRKALADDAKRPRFIETRHRRGYQFIARVSEAAHIDLLAALAHCGRIEEEAHVAAAGRPFENEGLPRSPLDSAWARAKRATTGACTTAITATVEPATDARIGASGGRRASIAVMPFLAPPGRDRHLADGLSHDIISGLARLRNLFVIARGSTFALRDQTSNPQEIGRALHVDYAATGSVLRDGNRLVVTVDLCATDNGRVVWADAYETPIADPFAILGDIAARIIGSLDAEIEAAERNRAMLKPPNSLDAWEAHHRGLWHMYRFTGPDNEEAQCYFRRAVTLDPTFSRAYAGLSFTHWENAFLFKPAERQAEADRAFDTAGRSLLADRRDPAAHWAMGRALWLRAEDAASVGALNEAVALSPNFAMAHYTLGFVQAQTGDPQAAVEAADVARQLSPFDPMLYAMCAARAFALCRAERCDEAAEWALKAAEKPNAHVHVHALAALVLATAGQLEDSFREVGAMRRLQPTYSIDDFLSSFRVLSDTERKLRAAAKQIGVG
jgi:TolB-like protein/DNA-binding winged helix-turn-helix (wHTH) protein